MKRNLSIILLLILLLTVWLFGQELSKLRLADQPQRSANEFVGASIRDANERICMAIKVISDMEGFKYTSNNGIVKVDDQPGQDMVYVSPDEMVLEIFHTGYEPLKVIFSEQGILAGERVVWTIRVAGEQPKARQISITVISFPAGAEVHLDGENRGAGKQHTVAGGSHQLRLLKAGYQTVEQTIQVDEQNTLFEFDLSPQEDVNVQIDSDPADAVVYIDGVKLGKTLVSAFYPAGCYRIRLEKEWYVTFEDTITVRPAMQRQKYVLQPDFGTVTVSSAPHSGLTIYLNNTAQNAVTPHVFERLLPGNYRFRAKSDLYETEEAPLTLSRGERKELKLVSSAGFAQLTIKTLPGATVYLNGAKIEQLENLRLEPAIVTLRAEMKKARSVDQRLLLKKGDVQTIELLPEMPVGTIQVAVVPVDAQIELRGDAGEYYSAVGAKSFSNIPIGSYVILVKLAKYSSHEETIVLQEGEKISKSVTLAEDQGVWRDAKTNIEFVLIKGGTFQMGDLFDEGEYGEKPVHTVTVSDFYLGKTEVTVGQFRRFIDATGYRTDAELEGWAYVWSGNNWGKVNGAGWLKPGFAQEDNHPVVCVSWNDAMAFCQWSGFRLPTEAEWEYAGRAGGNKQRYGWGDDPPTDQRGGNVADESAKKKFPSWPIFTGYDDGYVFTAPVAHFVANGLGLYDMTGNVWEWCTDWYDDGYYQQSPEVNPQGRSSGQNRVLRGGSWDVDPYVCRACNRGRNNPGHRSSSNGFRVARAAQ